jgi:prepilin-type N-terminal cleavage/methylation domain-containing protein
MNKNKGFTLIELAIVLVIIGLLLGFVLNGQPLIDSAKVKKMARDFQNVQLYLHGYQDRFKVLPGDDHAADEHVGGVNAANGTRNGLIEGNWDTANNEDESCVIWQHVRLAGLSAGTAVINCGANNQYQPRNADGGLIGVQSLAGFNEITGMRGAYVVCSDAILGRLAAQIDATLDDGVGNTGSVRMYVRGDNATDGVASPVDGTAYVVCMSF